MFTGKVLSDCMSLLDQKDALLVQALEELRRLADDQLSHTEEELGDAARVDLSLVREIEIHIGLQEAGRDVLPFSSRDSAGVNEGNPRTKGEWTAYIQKLADAGELDAVCPFSATPMEVDQACINGGFSHCVSCMWWKPSTQGQELYGNVMALVRLARKTDLGEFPCELLDAIGARSEMLLEDGVMSGAITKEGETWMS